MDPFTLTEKDGYFYGRGTSDIKDEVADLASNFIRLKREGFAPARDMILAFTDDEEGGEFNGAKWLVANRRDLVDVAYVINVDAAGGQLKDGKHLRNPVQTSEKLYVTYTMEVVNPGGHSSMPVPDNAIYRLARGLERLSRFEFPARLNETTRAYFKAIAEQKPGQVGADLAAIARGKPDPRAVARLGASPFYHAMMRNTCVATMLQAGRAENAPPAAGPGNDSVPPAPRRGARQRAPHPAARGLGHADRRHHGERAESESRVAGQSGDHGAGPADHHRDVAWGRRAAGDGSLVHRRAGSFPAGGDSRVRRLRRLHRRGRFARARP